MGVVAIKLVKRLLLLALLAGAAATFGAYHYFNQWLYTPMAIPPEGLVYHLERGSSLSRVVDDLAQQGVLQHPEVLLAYSKIRGNSEVKAGDYELNDATTPSGLLHRLHSGDVIDYNVTLVEGWTFAQAVRALSEAPRIDSQLHGLSQEEQLSLLQLPIEHPEGWFFPDTYHYSGGTSDIDILTRAYQTMQETLAELWPARDMALPYQTPYEALIMASIVERETGAAWERQKIAGVFVRRIQQGMRLQTDPTVIYGMGEQYQGRITRKDLRTASAYNTYMINGLPPTPIALPGREAIYASLHPDSGSEVYFVAKGDGTHEFSDTLEQHNRAVKRYQLKRSDSYRSTVQPNTSLPEASLE